MWDNLGPNITAKKIYWIIKFCIGQFNFADPFLAAQEGQYSYKLSSWSAFDCSLCGLDRAKPTVHPFASPSKLRTCRYQITLLRENGQKITGLKLLQVLLNKLNFILQVIWIDLNDLDLTG